MLLLGTDDPNRPVMGVGLSRRFFPPSSKHFPNTWIATNHIGVVVTCMMIDQLNSTVTVAVYPVSRLKDDLGNSVWVVVSPGGGGHSGGKIVISFTELRTTVGSNLKGHACRYAYLGSGKMQV